MGTIYCFKFTLGFHSDVWINHLIDATALNVKNGMVLWGLALIFPFPEQTSCKPKGLVFIKHQNAVIPLISILIEVTGDYLAIKFNIYLIGCFTFVTHWHLKPVSVSPHAQSFVSLGTIINWDVKCVGDLYRIVAYLLKVVMFVHLKVGKLFILILSHNGKNSGDIGGGFCDSASP